MKRGIIYIIALITLISFAAAGMSGTDSRSGEAWFMGGIVSAVSIICATVIFRDWRK